MMSDGGFYDADELYRAMAAEVSAFRPDIIFAPDPCVTSEFHKDHLNVGRAAGNIACFAPYRGIMNEMGLHPAPVRAVAFFMTAKPDVFVRTGKYFRVQMKALSCHESQFDEGNVIFTYLRLRSLNYGFRKLSLHAEAFRLLSRTELHCLPDRRDQSPVLGVVVGVDAQELRVLVEDPARRSDYDGVRRRSGVPSRTAVGVDGQPQ